ncbi:thioredoxin [Kaistia geumhonensis]|uniref:Thioredoxin n=1 Tax=Kaistia geumhonensis TaxID=410839 RepID=A0ABU0M7T6_9HYPH|nr:thioredoxin [Kaistia geumhonensis]MCX5477749.1 thioredoxin [Kaistia geumhonensis]MDQ0517040.1 putative thioredoxin [Kaistia geumhonensis]
MNQPSYSFGSSYQPAAEPAGGGTDDLIRDTTTQAFARDVIEASQKQPVLVDFWAPWCGPCKQLTPVLEKVVKAAKGAVKLVKMNIDDHPSIAGQLGIQSIPAVIAFVGGRPVDGFMGALPEGQVKQFIERLGGAGGADEIEAALAEAEQLVAGGAVAEAAQLYAAILAAEPENLKALAGLASCHLSAGQIDEAKALLAGVPEAKAADPALAAVRAQLALIEQTAALGEEGELRARIAANRKDFAALFDLALLRNGKGDREEATDLLLEIVRADRNWEEDKARKQLVQLFEAWGPTDEATLSGRRRLSSILFS